MQRKAKKEKPTLIRQRVWCTLFDSPIGACAIAWDTSTVRALRLPAKTQQQLLDDLIGKTGATSTDTPPPWVRAIISRIKTHLKGRAQDLSKIPIRLEGLPPFFMRVYQAAKLIPSGQTVTYGELAKRAGSPRASRAVGMAMAKNPYPMIVPCHRVVGVGRNPGGFSAFGGVSTKARLLEIEGCPLQAKSLRDRSAKQTKSKKKRATVLLSGKDGRLPFDQNQALGLLTKNDRKLAQLVRRVGPFALTLQHLQNPYEALAEAIIYQQLNGKAAAAICRRFVDQIGGGRFPKPAVVLKSPTDRLRKVGLSGSKTRALQDLAARTLDGTVPSLAHLARMTDEEIVDRLTGIRGVGRWTVEMLLIFRMGRPDVLPASDYGIRKGLTKFLNRTELLSPKEVAAYGERWKPYRSVASWYLWRLLEEKPDPA